MLTKLIIQKIASYDTPAILDNLSKLNLFFGANGSGKTTISRIIANPNNYHTSSELTWKNGNELQSLVYNQDFINKNFNQQSDLQGVFTLGEENIAITAKILELKGNLAQIKDDIAGLNVQLNGNEKIKGKFLALETLTADFTNKSWLVFTKHKDDFLEAFSGFRKDKEKFRQKIIQESLANQTSQDTIDQLKADAKIFFGIPPAPSPNLINITNISELAILEGNPILSKCIFGKEQIDIGSLISKLHCSDWVKRGREYLNASEGICPFCQQPIDKSLYQKLSDYFDETFEHELSVVNSATQSYKLLAKNIIDQIEKNIAIQSEFADNTKLALCLKNIAAIIRSNNARLEEKITNPSQSVTLESIEDELLDIQREINAAQQKINIHNVRIKNFAAEKFNLIKRIWCYISKIELMDAISVFTKETSSLNKAISNIQAQIKTNREKYHLLETELINLEKQTTSTKPTVDAINLILRNFGFNSFLLTTAPNGKDYKIVRPDGSDAKTTLSEGEKTFITFLYFFQMLDGNHINTGLVTDRIVVFDDPISSLDSDILFIVSTLIKTIYDQLRTDKSHIKQLFILTHNLYFFKEVAFIHAKTEKTKGKVSPSFWIVRKNNNISTIKFHNENPIKTSYELLWVDIKRSDISPISIQNTLRRIIENYFKVLGGIDTDEICEKFDGQEKTICKSLISWVNDGSHFTHDDIYVADGQSSEIYLRIFEEIFKKMNHHSHYKMMMRV